MGNQSSHEQASVDVQVVQAVKTRDYKAIEMAVEQNLLRRNLVDADGNSIIVIGCVIDRFGASGTGAARRLLSRWVCLAPRCGRRVGPARV